MFRDTYKNKKVLVTGNTGFKGSWLTLWLLSLGAKVVGISKDIPTNPSLFESLELEKKITHYPTDIFDDKKVKKIFKDEQPDYVFHLAAQAIVSTSYEEPIETFKTNAIGTLSILEAINAIKNECIAIMITSDKCYENVEWCYGYKETDHLGGKDIYSGSKAAAEAVIRSYFNSFLIHKDNIRIAIARAGNVIGGGDWAKDRIVVDSMRSWSKDEKLIIRSPESTRPWQHVLEPLSGYLHLGSTLKNSSFLNGEPFNFGPKDNQNRTVIELIDKLKSNSIFKNKAKISVKKNDSFFESSLLKLNCDKALMHLSWEPNLNFEQTVNFVASWYNNYFSDEEAIDKYTSDQILEYCKIGKEKELTWTK